MYNTPYVDVIEVQDYSELISDAIREIVGIIVLDKPEFVFCGSLGLVLNGVLKRRVKDIDVKTPKNYYRYSGGEGEKFTLSEYRLSNGYSDIFDVGNTTNHCWSAMFKNTKVDFIYNGLPLDYRVINWRGINIKVEEPKYAIKSKIEYLSSISVSEAKHKHLIDLFDMVPEWVSRQEFKGALTCLVEF